MPPPAMAEAAAETDHTQRLPPELWVRVLRGTDYLSGIRLSQTNRFFNQLITPRIWSTEEKSNFVYKSQYWDRHDNCKVGGGIGAEPTIFWHADNNGLACFHCFKVLPMDKFSLNQMTNRHAKYKPHTAQEDRSRFCITCGVAKGMYRISPRFSLKLNIVSYRARPLFRDGLGGQTTDPVYYLGHLHYICSPCGHVDDTDDHARQDCCSKCQNWTTLYRKLQQFRAGEQTVAYCKKHEKEVSIADSRGCLYCEKPVCMLCGQPCAKNGRWWCGSACSKRGYKFYRKLSRAAHTVRLDLNEEIFDKRAIRKAKDPDADIFSEVSSNLLESLSLDDEPLSEACGERS